MKQFVSYMAAALLTGFPGIAREPAPKDTVPVGIRLAADLLRAYEGYYRSPQNDDVIVQVVLVGDTLHFKPVWNNVDFQLVPQSDTIFYDPAPTEGNRQMIRFVKDRQGLVLQLAPGGKGPFWSKLANYNPVEPKEIPHSPEQLKVFEGTYVSKLNAAYFVQLTEHDNTLVLKQYWNGEDVLFVPDSALHFFSREQRLLKLSFNREEDGSIRRMKAFNKEPFEKVTPPPLSKGFLQKYEGKYRLKEDPDDVIQVTASDSGLIVRQLWDGKEMALRPLAESFFYNRDRAYTLYFKKDKDGAIASALALYTDLFEKVRE